MTAKASRRPARPAATQTGCYLYAVIDATADTDFGPCGIDDGKVYTIANGKVAAVVSDLPDGKVRPERRRLAAHQGVLKRLMAEHTVLPVTFGLVAQGPDAVRRMLAAHGGMLGEQLMRLAGKVEMGLRVLWDVPNIFEFFVNTHADLRLLRDQLFRGAREPSQEDKIALGRLFDRTLAEDRAALTERVLGVLRPHCFEIAESKLRDEREVMTLACLIGRDAQKEFEQAVFAAAKFFDNHYSFDFNGPWPPHSFVEVALQL